MPCLGVGMTALVMPHLDWAGRYALYQLFFLYPLSTNRHWAYPFMDTGTLWVLPWMLGLLALHVIIFGACLACGWVIRGTLSRRKHAFFSMRPHIVIAASFSACSSHQVMGRRPVAAAPLSMNATLITASQRQRRSADGRNQWLIGSQEYLEPMERVV